MAENDLYGHISLVWRKWNTLPSISMEITSLRSKKWWNFSWKIIKMTPEKTKIPLFHLKSSSICLEMTNMVIYVWFEENEIHHRQFTWKFRVLRAKNDISTEKSSKWPPEKTKIPLFLLISSSIWLEMTYMVM